MHTAINTGSIKSTTNDVVTNTRQILYTTATNQNNAVFLQVVADTWDISRNFDQVGQTNTSVLTQS